MQGNRLDSLRTALLDAHKALIDDAKRQYVAAGNKAPTPVEFWQLLMNGPAFQWLRRISETIVAIDEAVEKQSMDEAQAFSLVREELFLEASYEFNDKLKQAIGRDPFVRLAWQKVVDLAK